MRRGVQDFIVELLNLDSDASEDLIVLELTERLLKLEEDMSQANTHVRAVQHALTEINPGWEYGAHFHCTCATCS